MSRPGLFFIIIIYYLPVFNFRQCANSQTSQLKWYLKWDIIKEKQKKNKKPPYVTPPKASRNIWTTVSSYNQQYDFDKKKSFPFFWPEFGACVTELLNISSSVIQTQFLTHDSVIQKHRDPIFISINLVVYVFTWGLNWGLLFLVPLPLPFWAGWQITFSSHFPCPTLLFHSLCNIVANSVPNSSGHSSKIVLIWISQVCWILQWLQFFK